MSSKPFKVLITGSIPKQRVSEILSEKCFLVMFDCDEQMSARCLNNCIKGVDGVLCLLTDKIRKNTLDSAGPSLKVVSTMSVGVDHIDLKECAKRGILVGHTPDVLTAATAEFTVGLLLATSRRIVEAAREAKIGRWGAWTPMWMCGPSLDGSVVGIVGLGRIGIATLERLRPFGPRKFLYNNTNRKTEEEEKKLDVEFCAFDNLLHKSDFVICLCALTKDSKNLFDKSAFDKMQESAVFINSSRGGTVDQDALYEALVSGSIGAAGIDVTTPEPLPTDHPLFELPNCVITPHIGSATYETRETMAALAAENLLCALEGREMPAKYPI